MLVRPDLEPSNPSAWRLSGVPGGNPGVPDSRVFQGEPDADLDGDGLPALLEYALGTTDTHPESGPSSMSAHFAAGKAANFEFLRQIDADEVMVWVEHSRNLSEWTPSKRIAAEPNGMGQSRETWEAPDPADEPLFLRLRAQFR